MSEEFEVPSTGMPETAQPGTPQPEVVGAAPGGTGLAPNVAGALCYLLGLSFGARDGDCFSDDRKGEPVCSFPRDAIHCPFGGGPCGKYHSGIHSRFWMAFSPTD